MTISAPPPAAAPTITAVCREDKDELEAATGRNEFVVPIAWKDCEVVGRVACEEGMDGGDVENKNDEEVVSVV